MTTITNENFDEELQKIYDKTLNVKDDYKKSKDYIRETFKKLLERPKKYLGYIGSTTLRELTEITSSKKIILAKIFELFQEIFVYNFDNFINFLKDQGKDDTSNKFKALKNFYELLIEILKNGNVNNDIKITLVQEFCGVKQHSLDESILEKQINLIKDEKIKGEFNTKLEKLKKLIENAQKVRKRRDPRIVKTDPEPEVAESTTDSDDSEEKDEDKALAEGDNDEDEEI